MTEAIGLLLNDCDDFGSSKNQVLLFCFHFIENSNDFVWLIFEEDILKT